MQINSIHPVNGTKIEAFQNELYDEVDLDTQLSRYESMTPELIELAQEHGLSDVTNASRALFIADFVLTSSEFAMGITDEERRISIIKAFYLGIKQRNQDTEKLMEVIYLANKIFIAMKRNNSYLAGRGVDEDARKIILCDLFLIPYLSRCRDILGNGDFNWEFGILKAVVEKTLPDTILETLFESRESRITKDNLLKEIWELISSFNEKNQVELNEDAPLPNINETKILYLYRSDQEGILSSTYNIENKPNEQILENIEDMNSFLERYDNHNSLIYLRGRLINTDNNLIITRDPEANGKPLVMFQTPAEEINVTEMQSLLKLRSELDQDWEQTGLMSLIVETYEEEVTEQVKDTKEKEVEEEIEVEKEDEEEKTGFFGKIKNFLFGGKKKKTKRKKVTKTVQEEVMRDVTKTVEKENIIAKQLPEFLSQSLAIYGFADLRLFEKFDTARETEYMIMGALETDFESKETGVLATDRFENPEQISNMLDGLDEVIEEVLNNYFGDENQILPTEILFFTPVGDRFIITFDGNDKRIVGTIAQTYHEDITDWQEKDNTEPVKRRTLHMRTGQLLSARDHTPFDTATERILGRSTTDGAKIIKLDKAILPL